MNVKFRLLLTTLWGLCFLLGSGSAKADWPQYRGPHTDGTAGGEISDLDWSAGPKVLWKVPTPLGFSSFSVADGRVFTLISRNKTQTCVAMDANTGKEIWDYALNEEKYDGGGDVGAPNNRGGDGPRTTPTIDGDHVYVYDAQLLLVCLNAKNGELVWQRDIKREFKGRNIPWGNATSPIVHGDNVYVAGGGTGQSLLAFNKATGKIAWKKGDEKLTHANPVITKINDKELLVFFLQSGLVAVDPGTGTEIWRTDFPYNVSTAASPVFSGNEVYCSAGYSVGAGLFRIDGSMNVENIWRKENKLINHWSTPVIHAGHVYGIFGFKKYGKAPLQCVELATGKIKWKQAGFGPGNCILVGEKLVVLSDAGELAIVAAKPDQYQELARSKVLNGKCWSMPAYSDGKIFIRSTQEGACIAVE